MCYLCCGLVVLAANVRQRLYGQGGGMDSDVNEGLS